MPTKKTGATQVTPLPKKSAAQRRSSQSKAKVEANAAAVAKLNAVENETLEAAAFVLDQKAAITERAALRKWQADPVGDKPVTPNLDAIKISTQTAAQRKANGGDKPKSAGRRTSPEIVFIHDGVPMRDTLNRLVDVAWRFTKGLDEDRERIGVAELRAVLAKAGINEPDSTTWSHTLANGITLGAIKRSSLATSAAKTKTPEKAPASARTVTRKAS